MLHVIDLDGPTPLSLKVDNPRAGNIEWIDNRRFLVAQQPSTINTTVDKRCSQEWGEGGHRSYGLAHTERRPSLGFRPAQNWRLSCSSET